MARIDGDGPAGREVEPLPLKIQRHEGAPTGHVAPQKVFTRLEAEHRPGVELPRLRVLGQEDRASRRRGGELAGDDLDEMRSVRGEIRQAQAEVMLSTQQFQIHRHRFLLATVRGRPHNIFMDRSPAVKT